MKQYYIDIINEDTPCDGCIHVQKCGSKRLACYAFAMYVNNGTVDWEVKRAPTKDLYKRAMRLGDNDGSLMREINQYRKGRATV